MVDERALLEALRVFATRSVEDYDPALALEDVGAQACAVLGLDGAGITLRVGRGDREMQYISATNLPTLRVERAQDELDEGPCRDAIRARRPVTAVDVEGDERWARYRAVVLDAGFRSVAGIPMFAHGRVVGALNAYRSDARHWDPDELDAGGLLANVATAYIANGSAHADQSALAGQLQRALDSRILIEQAKGILAERNGVSPEEAFALLRGHARRVGVKLHGVAADVVTGHLDLPGEGRGRRHPSGAQGEQAQPPTSR